MRAWCLAALARWPVPHGTQTIETPGGHTHVLSGRAGDQVCVYLPGTGFNVATSTAVLGALASWCGVYAADLPGQPGPSASTRPEDELSGYAGWVADLIRWVRSQHVHEWIALVGHSHGAAVGPVGRAGQRGRSGRVRPGRTDRGAPFLRDAEGHRAVAAAAKRRRLEPAARLHVRPRARAVRGPRRVDEPGGACLPARPALFGTTSCSGGGVATCGWWRSASTTSSFPSTGFVRHAAPRAGGATRGAAGRTPAARRGAGARS